MPDPRGPGDAPNCHLCRHYYITHDPAWPYGCRHFGLKARVLPSAEVLRSSGIPCRAFTPRAPDPRPRQR